jgi:adenylate cyclase
LKLGSALLLLFAILSIPPLLFILVYGHQRNEAAIVATLDQDLQRTMDQSVHAVSDLVGTVGKLMAIVGDTVAADPAYYRTNESYGVIWRTLVAADQIDALYTSFEDGFHRVVTRVDDDRRRSNPKIPQTAKWHASYIDAFAAGPARVRHRRFFADWPTPTGDGFNSPANVDIRTLDFYTASKRTRRLVVGEPSINPDTGSPVMTLGWPIIRQGTYLGSVGANMTLNLVSAYLRDNRVSPNSVTVILDRQGRVIAHSDPKETMRVVAGKPAFSTIGSLADRRLAEALAYRNPAGTPHFRFAASSGQELSVARRPFPAEFGKDWEIVIVTPTDDFVGDLRATNKAMSTVIALVIVLELGLIFILARRLSSDIEAISGRFMSVRELNLQAAPSRPSRIGEIAELQNGFQLLLNALGSFAKFVPLGVVRQFVSTGESIIPGVEPRQIAILFCDLEGFTEQSEKLAPADLLHQLTQYFAAITSAVTQEGGTVDKFIGDAVMALWGAPTAREDHTLRACTAAIRAKRRMEALAATWKAEGRPVMRVRIGLHTGEVLVGNIGSDDRLSYTAIGDGVNVSSRLEGVNKLFGTTICISGSIVAELSDTLVARPLRPIQVKGRRQELMIFELLGLRDSDDPETMASQTDIDLARMSSETVTLRLQGDLQGCTDLYRAILARYPDDEVTRLLLEEVVGDGLSV